MSEVLYLQTLEGAIDHLEEIPLWGYPPIFDWSKFSKALAKLFELKELKITHHKTEWKAGEEILSGVGKNPDIKYVNLFPLPNTFFLVFPKQSVETLISELLTSHFTDPILQEGYFQFAFLNAVETFNQINPFGNLTLNLSDQTALPEEGAFCIDIQIECGKKPIWARIVCSKEGQKSFKTQFETRSMITDTQFASLPLTCILEAGSTTLDAEEWSKVKTGDLLLLQRCTYDLQNAKGTAVLTLNEIPLLEVRIKEGSVKILEYALTTKEIPMSEEAPPEEAPSEEENLSQESSEEEKPLWSEENGEGEKPLLSSKNIPISLTLEIGRFQIPLEKLTQLKPGNVLDLKLNPELSVFLSTGGKKVAKGELVRLGDSIGVKILSIG